MLRTQTAHAAAPAQAPLTIDILARLFKIDARAKSQLRPSGASAVQLARNVTLPPAGDTNACSALFSTLLRKVTARRADLGALADTELSIVTPADSIHPAPTRVSDDDAGRLVESLGETKPGGCALLHVMERAGELWVYHV